MSQWIARLQHLGQTRAPSADAQAVAIAEAQADRRTVATLCACMAAAQTLLWLLVAGVDMAGRALWQAAAAQLAPLLALYALWRWVMRRAAPLMTLRMSRMRRFCLLTLPALLLLPCLWLDGGLLLLALTALSARVLSPTLPVLMAAVLALAAALAAALLGGSRGAPCAASQLRRLLPLALLACTALAGLSPELGALYPLGGRGLAATAGAAAGLSGCVWAVGLYAMAGLRAVAREQIGRERESENLPRQHKRKASRSVQAAMKREAHRQAHRVQGEVRASLRRKGLRLPVAVNQRNLRRAVSKPEKPFAAVQADAEGAAPAILTPDAYAAPARATDAPLPDPDPVCGLEARVLPPFLLAWGAGLWTAAYLCLCQPWRPGTLSPAARLTVLTRPAGAALLSHAAPLALATLLGLALCGCAWAGPELLRGAKQPKSSRAARAGRCVAALIALLPCAAPLLLPPDATLTALCNLGWLRWPLATLSAGVALLATLGARRRA